MIVTLNTKFEVFGKDQKEVNNLLDDFLNLRKNFQLLKEKREYLINNSEKAYVDYYKDEEEICDFTYNEILQDIQERMSDNENKMQQIKKALLLELCKNFNIVNNTNIHIQPHMYDEQIFQILKDYDISDTQITIY